MTAKHTGFTLIELMVALAVLGILLSIAIPSFQNMVLDNRIAAQANQVITALNYARSEAVKRGASATLCPTSGGAACAGSTNWSTGWLVFADADGNGTVGAGEAVLRVWPAPKGGNTLNTGTRQRITFGATGTATGSNDTFRLCDGRGTAAARSIVVNVMGRSYVEKGAKACP